MISLYLLFFMALLPFAATDSQQQSVEAINLSWSDDRAVKILIDDFELHLGERESAMLNMPVEQDLSLEVRVAGIDHVYTDTVQIVSGTDRVVIRLDKDENKRDDEEYSSADEYELRVIQQKMPVMIGGMQSVYDNLVYPRSAIRRNQEGTAHIGFIIYTEGEVSNVRVVSSSGHRSLDRAAMEALEKVRFEPGTADGNLTRFRMTQPVVFRFNN